MQLFASSLIRGRGLHGSLLSRLLTEALSALAFSMRTTSHNWDRNRHKVGHCGLLLPVMMNLMAARLVLLQIVERLGQRRSWLLRNGCRFLRLVLLFVATLWVEGRRCQSSLAHLLLLLFVVVNILMHPVAVVGSLNRRIRLRLVLVFNVAVVGNYVVGVLCCSGLRGCRHHSLRLHLLNGARQINRLLSHSHLLVTVRHVLLHLMHLVHVLHAGSELIMMLLLVRMHLLLVLHQVRSRQLRSEGHGVLVLSATTPRHLRQSVHLKTGDRVS